MIKRKKFHLLFLFFMLVSLSSCDTSQIEEDDTEFSDDNFISDAQVDYNQESSSEFPVVNFGGTFVEGYAEQGVLCGEDLVDFPDHSFVAKFVMGNDVFTSNNLKKYMKEAVSFYNPDTESTESYQLEVSGLDLDLILQNSKKLFLPFVVPSGMQEEELNVYIDWGDGTCEKVNSAGQLNHEYGAKGIYEVKVIGNAFSLGGSSNDFVSLAAKNFDIKKLMYRLNLYEVVELGDLNWKYLYSAFAYSYGLRKFRAKHTDTSEVKTMAGMFDRTYLKEIDVSNFDLSSLESLTLDAAIKWPLESFTKNNWYLQQLTLPDFDGASNNSLYGLGNVFSSQGFPDGGVFCGGAETLVIETVPDSPEHDQNITCRQTPHTEKFCRHPGVEFSSYPQPILKKLNNRNKELDFFCEQGYYGGGRLTCNEGSGEYEITEGSSCLPLSCASASVDNSNYSSSSSIRGRTGDQVSVICDEGYWGGGTWTCLPNRSFKGKSCRPVTFTQSYASSEGISCDYIDSEGHPASKNVQFPDHSMALQYQFVVPAGGGSTELVLPLSSSQNSFMSDLGGPNFGSPHLHPINLWVDWGDGTCNRYAGINNQKISRVFENGTGSNITKNLNVRIIGEGFTTFHDFSITGNAYLTSVLNFGDLKLKSAWGGFRNTLNLSTFNANGGKYSNFSNILDFNRMMDFFRSIALEINFSSANMASGLSFDHMFNQARVNKINLQDVKLFNSFSFKGTFSDLFIQGDDKEILLGENAFFQKSVDYNGMFFDANLEKISINNFTASNSWDLRSIFSVNDLEELYINERTSSPNAQFYGGLFSNTNSLKNALDLSWLNSSEATWISDMFSGVQNLTSTEANAWGEIDLSNMEFPKTMVIQDIIQNQAENRRPIFHLPKDFSEWSNGNLTDFIPYLSIDDSFKYISCGGDDYISFGGLDYPCFNECSASFDNGVIASVKEGEVAAVNCQTGYEAEVESLTCEFGGFVNVPSCTPVVCEEFSPDNSLTVIVQGNYFSPEVSVMCNEGYVGGGNWSCSAEGSWSGGSCDPVVCNELTPDNSSTNIAQGNYETDPVAVVCNEGYVGGGDWSCSAEGTWSGDECVVLSTDESPTFTQDYSVENVNCGGDIVNFPDHSFVLEMNSGVNGRIHLPVDLSVEGIDFYVDWGDETCSHITSSSASSDLEHDYVASGHGTNVDLTLRITGTLKNWGNDFNTNYYDRVSRVVNLGSVGWEDLSYAFYYTSITEFNSLHSDTSNVLDMSYMFRSTSGLISLDLSSFNTSNVESMNSMFRGASGLETIDLSSFNTSNVESMNSMFSGAGSLTSLDLSSFNTSNVTSMYYMFNGASGLTSLDLSSFNTSNVTSMNSMFANTSSLTFLDISSFDTSNVVDMSSMFYGASGLTSLDLSNFDTSNVESMSYMFFSASGLTSLDLSNFDTSNVEDMVAMFNSASGLETLDLSSFNTSNVESMNSMFNGASGLTSLDLSSFNTSNVEDMAYMFSGAIGLETLDLSSFNTSSVTNMGRMFSYASGLTSLDLSSFNTSNVEDMLAMFSGASGLETLDLSSFNTSNVEDMSSMFSGASGLETLDLSSFNTSNVESMSYMFYGASGLETLDLSNFDTSNVESMNSMFRGASGLETLDLSSFNTSSVTNMYYMFNGARGLTSLDLGFWERDSLSNSFSFFLNAGNPNFSTSGENTNLICLNDDDSSSEGYELFIGEGTYSCDGE